MKIRTRVLAGVASMTLAGGMALMATPAHAAAITVNVHDATVTCDTLAGSLKFSTPLTITGPTTGAATVTVKTTLAGCTSPDVNSGNSIFSGSSTGTLTGTGGSNCTGLSGLSSSTTGTQNILWKAPKGYLFSPTQTIGTKTGPFTQSTISQSLGTSFTVPTQDGNATPVAQGPWAGTAYGEFQVGTAYGTTQLHGAGEGSNDVFLGGDNGHAGWISATTNQGTIDLFGLCTGTGIKSITFGIGGVHGG